MRESIAQEPLVTGLMSKLRPSIDMKTLSKGEPSPALVPRAKRKCVCWVRTVIIKVRGNQVVRLT